MKNANALVIRDKHLIRSVDRIRRSRGQKTLARTGRDLLLERIAELALDPRGERRLASA